MIGSHDSSCAWFAFLCSYSFAHLFSFCTLLNICASWGILHIWYICRFWCSNDSILSNFLKEGETWIEFCVCCWEEREGFWKEACTKQGEGSTFPYFLHREEEMLEPEVSVLLLHLGLGNPVPKSYIFCIACFWIPIIFYCP